MEEAPLKPQTPETSDDDDDEEEERGSALAEMFRSRREKEEERGEEPDEDSGESFFAKFEDSPEVEPAPEAEAPEEGMSAEAEAPVVASTLAEHELQQIPEHGPEEPVDEEAAADMAAADFLERVRDDGDLEAAEAATAEALEAQPEPAPAEEAPVEEVPELVEDAELEPIEIDPEAPRELAEEDMVSFQNEVEPEQPEADMEDEPEDPARAATQPVPPPVPPVPPSGGGNVPPTPPVPPHGSGGSGGPTGPYGPGVPNMPNFNTAPVTSPNTPPVPSAERIRDGASPAAMALFGGIVGYLIGRRRGRIKTEKKLLPVQKKLEKQVTDMHWELKAKEAKIRQLAREKVRQNGPAAVETLAAAAVARKTEKAEKPAAEQKVKPLVITKTIEVPAEKAGRQRAPEAHQLHGAVKTPEQNIGHMLMAAEAVPLIVSGGQHELAPPKADRKEQKELQDKVKQLTETRVETLNRAELMEISEKIIIDGSSLRQIYETHLIGEHGLRRLVKEHLRGGDLKKALRREIVEREIDFERDPALRDKLDPGKTGSNDSGGGTPQAGGQDALGRMIERASATLPADSEQAAFYKARANYEVQQRQQDEKKRRLVDAAFGVTIVALTGAIVLIYLLRG